MPRHKSLEHAADGKKLERRLSPLETPLIEPGTLPNAG